MKPSEVFTMVMIGTGVFFVSVWVGDVLWETFVDPNLTTNQLHREFFDFWGIVFWSAAVGVTASLVYRSWVLGRRRRQGDEHKNSAR